MFDAWLMRFEFNNLQHGSPKSQLVLALLCPQKLNPMHRSHCLGGFSPEIRKPQMPYRLKSLEINVHTYSRARAYHALPVQLWHGAIKTFSCHQALLGDFSRYQIVISYLKYCLRYLMQNCHAYCHSIT